ncbi:hypothetical protein ACFLVP_01165 [Chloroflexota bacterium]
MGETSKWYYRAYFQLHDIHWELKEPIKLILNPTGIIIELGNGPYRVPKMASPIAITKAGSTTIEFPNEIETLEGKTYFASNYAYYDEDETTQGAKRGM